MFILMLSSSLLVLSQPQKSATLQETCFKIKGVAKVYPELGPGLPPVSYPEVIRCVRTGKTVLTPLTCSHAAFSAAVSSGNKFSHLFLGRETMWPQDHI